MTSFSQNLSEYKDYAVGDRVIVPGHGRNDPATPGTLTNIVKMNFPRSVGYFAEVETDSGRTVTTAIGIIRKESV